MEKITGGNINGILSEIKKGNWFGEKHLKSLDNFSEWDKNDCLCWLAEYRKEVYFGFGELLIHKFNLDIVPILDLDPKRAHNYREIWENSSLSEPKRILMNKLISFVALDHISLLISGEVGSRIFYPIPLKSYGSNLEKYTNHLNSYEGDEYFFVWNRDNKEIKFTWDNTPGKTNKINDYLLGEIKKDEEIDSNLKSKIYEIINMNDRSLYWPV